MTDIKDHKDKSTSLIVVGVLQILLGALCGIMGLISVLGSAAMSFAPTEVAEISGQSPALMAFIGIAFYGGLAAFFIVMGIGTVRGRRWARALMLVMSSIALVGGVFGFVMMAFILPDSMDYASAMQGSSLPEGVTTVITAITMACMGIFYILIPGAFVAFFKSPHVKATCEAKNPEPSWTDKAPLPVLALSLLLGMGMLGSLYMCFYNFASPLFGIFVSGVAGALVIAVQTVAMGVLSWGTFRLKMWAWIGSLVAYALMFANSTISFLNQGLIAFYEQMGMSELQLDAISQQPLFAGNGFALMISGMGIVMIGYVVFTLRYFKAARHG